MKKNWHTYLWYSALSLAVALLSFYLYLSFFSVPAVDDYTFAFLVRDKGLLAAQEYWYTIWTGRYTSSFLISLSPLLWQSIVLYGLYSFSLICLSFLSLHYFIRSLFQPYKFSAASILLSLICTLLFLDKMPNITDGFYWMPGAFTYQLSNVLLAFFLGLLIRINRNSNHPKNRQRYFWAIFLSLLICGTNEVAMLLSVLFTGLNFVFISFVHSHIKKLDLLLIAATIIFACVMYFAPGNEGRSGNFSDLSSANNIRLALDASFSEIHYRLTKWSIHPFLFTVIAGLSLGLMDGKARFFIKPFYSVLLFLAMLLFGYLVVLLSVFPALYVSQDTIPTRTLNVTFWMFMLITIGLSYLTSAIVKTWIGRLFSWQSLLLPIVSISIAIFLVFSNGSQANAISDVLKGSASAYRQQYLERHSIMKACTKDTCLIPAYSAFPHTVYHSDLLVDKGNWWTSYFKAFYQKEQVNIDDTRLKPFYKNSFGFENGNKINFLSSVPAVDSTYSYTGKQSVHITEEIEYCLNYSLHFDTLHSRPGEKAAYIIVNCMARLQKPKINLNLVAAIQDPAFNKMVSWQASSIQKQGGAGKNPWQELEILIDLTSLSIKPEFELGLYFWNPDEQIAHVDDLSITIY